MLLDKEEEEEVEEEEGRRMSEYEKLSQKSQLVWKNKVEVTSNMAVVLAVSGRGMPHCSM